MFGIRPHHRGQAPGGGLTAPAAGRTVPQAALRFREVPGAVVDLLFPRRCPICGGPVPGTGTDARRQRDAPAGGPPAPPAMPPEVCPVCAGSFIRTESPVCTVCGLRFAGRSGGDHTCGSCLRRSSRYASARSAGLHRGALRRAVHELKYGGRMQLAEPMGRLLFDAFRYWWPAARLDRIVAVPLHARRFRRRGFNQAFVLLRDWKRMAEAEGARIPDPWADRRLLVRRRRTDSQTGLGKPQRSANVRGAFAVTDAAAVGGKRILLVDDVFTTGATADACARVLCKAGAARVDVLTLSRVP